MPDHCSSSPRVTTELTDANTTGAPHALETSIAPAPAVARRHFLTPRVAFALAFVAACRSSVDSRTAPRTPVPSPTPTPPSSPSASTSTATDRFAAMCERDNRAPAFRGCPHWRVAMPDVCGTGPEPSFMNPCRCMCDLCTADGDCSAKPGGACLVLPSAVCGGYDQKACVYPGEPCHPSSKRCRSGQACYNFAGAAQCEKVDHKLCD